MDLALLDAKMPWRMNSSEECFFRRAAHPAIDSRRHARVVQMRHSVERLDQLRRWLITGSGHVKCRYSNGGRVYMG